MQVVNLLYLYRSVYPQTGWNSGFSIFWTNSIFPLFSPLIVLRSQVLVLPRNRLPGLGDCTENNPSVFLYRYIQKHQKICGTVTHSSNCLEPKKRGENVNIWLVNIEDFMTIWWLPENCLRWPTTVYHCICLAYWLHLFWMTTKK